MISIIVPIYNSEKYLNRCINSILVQTFTDFELLLINDGSTDSSGDICNEHAKKDSRIRVFHKKNGGVTSARRLGVEESKGEYISFVDSDDNLYPKSLEILINNITSNDIDIVVSDIANESIISGQEFVKNSLLWRVQASVWGRLYRKDLFDNTSFDVSRNLIVGEDLFMNIKVGLKARLVKCINQSVYNYYKNPNSITCTRSASLEYEKFYIDEISRALGDKINEFKDELYNIKLGALEFLIVCKVSVSYTQDWIIDLISWSKNKKLSFRQWCVIYIRHNLLCKYILAIEKRIKKFFIRHD
ncbi:MAG: glycosyltransferase [Bacteroidaceae bacterium]|nr:glycosyltransferase [Bacteroidaceae bacterium]